MQGCRANDDYIDTAYNYDDIKKTFKPYWKYLLNKDNIIIS
jgi:hypothetical protein